jgi:hypothetical protein
MKKIIITTGLALSLIATPALADCPSGVCDIDINATTGQVTYTDAVPRTSTPAPVIPVPVVPTHQVVIQTTNGSISTSGSYEQVQQVVQRVITAPQAPQPDACINGGCNKVIVNVTTGQVDVLPLSPADIQQRLIDQYINYATQLELSIAAKEAVIQPYAKPELPFRYFEPIENSTVSVARVAETAIKIDSTPVWYVTMDKSGKVNVVKKKPKALVRKRAK